jgi:hypothetical protein
MNYLFTVSNIAIILLRLKLHDRFIAFFIPVNAFLVITSSNFLQNLSIW